MRDKALLWLTGLGCCAIMLFPAILRLPPNAWWTSIPTGLLLGPFIGWMMRKGKEAEECENRAAQAADHFDDTRSR
jgi:hypothetical protein